MNSKVVNNNDVTDVAAPAAPTTETNKASVPLNPNGVNALVAAFGKEPRWMAWQFVGNEKKPISPVTGYSASCNDPATWTDYETAAAYVKANNLSSIGFALTDAAGFTPVTCIDWDHVCEAGAGMPSYVRHTVEMLDDSYTERSASGEGFHTIVYGAIPENVVGAEMKPSPSTGTRKVEVFSRNKMFALTLRTLPGYTEVKHANGHLPSICEKAKQGTFNRAIVAEKFDPVKLGAVLADEWGEYGFDSRSAAVQSALVLLALKHDCDVDKMREEFAASAICAAWEAKGKWTRLGDKEIKKAIEFVKSNEGKQRPAARDMALLDTEWFYSSDDFLTTLIKPREALITEITGAPVFYRKSLNQVFAQRGIGKSMFSLGLVNLMVHGGEFLKYKSAGGYRVLLIDAELPDVDLQARLRSIVGSSGGRLKLMTPERLPGHRFPSLANSLWQEELLRRLDILKPDAIIIDSLSAAFKFDTNEGGEDGWLNVNDFLIRLRMAGFCVVLIHHAGKAGTQRGRSDGDDHLDLSIKLEPAQGWEPGMPLEATLRYEKVRHGGGLRGFAFRRNDAIGRWELMDDPQEQEIVRLLLAGKTVRAIKTSLEVGGDRVVAIRRRLQEEGTLAAKAAEPVNDADLDFGVPDVPETEERDVPECSATASAKKRPPGTHKKQATTSKSMSYG